MIRLFAIMAGLVAAASAFADDKSPIRFPAVMQPAAPLPMPANADITLPADSSFVIESDVEVLAFASPSGAVKLTKEAGPLRLRGKFVGGTGGIESKTFTAKYLIIAEASGTAGRDELIIVPVGAKNEGEAKRVFLRVGTLPQPPPIDPKPDVKPDPVAPIKADGLHVLIVYKPGQALPETQNAILFGEKSRMLLDAKCVKDARGVNAYRILPDGVQFGDELQLWKDAYARGRKSIPWVIVSNGKDGFEGPLPATVAEFEALVNKYGK